MFSIRAIDIWNRVDELRKEIPLTDICKKAGIPYARVKRNRTDCRIPSCEDLFAISSELGTTMEYLITGTNNNTYPDRITIIANRCLHYATEEDLILIERILRIPSTSANINEKGSERTSRGTTA